MCGIALDIQVKKLILQEMSKFFRLRDGLTNTPTERGRDTIAAIVPIKKDKNVCHLASLVASEPSAGI